MNWITTQNNKRINALEIPTITIENLKADLRVLKLRPLGFFGKQEYQNVRLYVVLADDKNGLLYVSSVLFYPEIKSYEALTPEFPQFHMFEREFYEDFKIEPVGHPWLKPVRKNQDDYPFFAMKGEDIHEVAVGPIHAGIIEPGHFRFMCQGEKVYDLEIMLGYQYKNIENLMLNPNIRLAESICGDSVIAYSMAYVHAIEALSNTVVSKRAELIRRVALELERIAIHIGDMGAIAGDMAYLMASSIFGVTRTIVINTMLQLSGSRFGRGLVEVGGVNFDIDENLTQTIKTNLQKVLENTQRMADIMLKMPSCISRMEKTGHVTKEIAKALGAVGMSARASGVNLDTRFDFKDDWYKKLPWEKEIKPTGDVYSRFNIRYNEVKQSIRFVDDFLEELKDTEDGIKNPINQIEPHGFVVSIIEGWRGEVVHIAITGQDGEFIRYKIKDPSFNNWYMLAMAVRNNGISDFPLCNKS
ncbi:hydrogenase, partial [bacterium]|nr:hydrogenase [bacterium]